MTRFVALLALLASVAVACRSEDPARAALRARLAEAPQLSADELGRVREEVQQAIQGRDVRVKEDGATRDLTAEERGVVFGMLSEPAGMFDEGLQERAGEKLRVLNAPGLSDDPEIEATRRLWIDIDTFLPRRFTFNYAVPGRGDYEFDLEVD
jgi:hypothetical protein